MDLSEFLQYAYTTEQLDLMMLSNKIIGQLMSGDEQSSIAVYEKIPDIHRFIVQALDQVNLNEELVDPKLSKLRKIFVKESFWSLSNFAACNFDIIQLLIEDQIFEKVVSLLMTPGYQESDVLFEGMFVICNGATCCSDDQFRCFLSRDIVWLIQ